jgi:hypothetical protein
MRQVQHCCSFAASAQQQPLGLREYRAVVPFRKNMRIHVQR